MASHTRGRRWHRAADLQMREQPGSKVYWIDCRNQNSQHEIRSDALIQRWRAFVETLSEALDHGQDINVVLSKVRDKYRALNQLQIEKVQDIETKIQRITNRLTLSRAADRLPSPTSPVESPPVPERKTSTADRPKPGPSPSSYSCSGPRFLDEPAPPRTTGENKIARKNSPDRSEGSQSSPAQDQHSYSESRQNPTTPAGFSATPSPEAIGSIVLGAQPKAKPPVAVGELDPSKLKKAIEERRAASAAAEEATREREKRQKVLEEIQRQKHLQLVQQQQKRDAEQQEIDRLAYDRRCVENQLGLRGSGSRTPLSASIMDNASES